MLDENATPNTADIIIPQNIVDTENQARHTALSILAKTKNDDVDIQNVFLFATRGHIGAVGLATARHCLNFSIEVKMYLAGPEHRLSPLAKGQYDILNAYNARIDIYSTPDVIRQKIIECPASTLVLLAIDKETSSGRETDLAKAARDGIEQSTEELQLIELEAAFEVPPPSKADTIYTPPRGVKTREESRMVDSVAIERYKIPGLALMENAGWRVAHVASKMLDYSRQDKKVLVIAGGGNNGGDGFVAARHLHAWGIAVEVILVGGRHKMLDDAATNFDMAKECNIKIHEVVIQGMEEAAPELLAKHFEAQLADTDLIIDALLGTGLNGVVRGIMKTALKLLAETETPILAVDIPSGLDANTAEQLGAVSKASSTVTFGFAKPALLLEEGAKLTGELIIADIALPRKLYY